LRVLKIFFTALLLFISVTGSDLHQELQKMLDGGGRSKDYYRELGVLYVFAENHNQAAVIWQRLYKTYHDSFDLFNAALARTVVDPLKANLLWQQYLNLPEKKRNGPRWDSVARLIKEINRNQGVADKKKYKKVLRETYMGKGYYTVILLVDIYHRYHKPVLLYLETRAEMYMRAGYLKEAEERFKKIYGKYGGSGSLYYLGRVYFKQQKWPLVKTVYSKIKSSNYKDRKFYYTLGIAAFHMNDQKLYAKCLHNLKEKKDSSGNNDLLVKLESLKKEK